MKRTIALVLAIIIALPLFAACGGTASTSPSAGVNSPGSDAGGQSKSSDGSMLVFTSTDWTEGVDFCQAEWFPETAGLVADSLFLRESDGTLSPCMATGYTISDDGLTITFTLADDLKFYDGTPVTPKDVKRSIEWAQEKSMYASDFSAVQSIDINGNDIILHLSTYSPSILFYMSNNFWPTIKASEIDTMTPDQLRWKATSYGPYYVEEYVAGSHVILKRNEYYKTYNENVTNKGPVPVETIKVRFTTDSFAIVQGMLANEIDFTFDMNESNLKELASNKDIKCDLNETTGVYRLALNPSDPLFSDSDVRLALTLLLDREKMAEYSEGSFRPAYAFSVKGMLDYDKNVEDYYKENYCGNADKGLKLLTDKGWKDTDGDGYLDKDGKKLAFMLMYQDDVQKRIFEFTQVMLKEYGIQVDGTMIDAGTYNDSVKAGGNYQACLIFFGWGDTATTLPYLVPDKSIIDLDAFIANCTEASAIKDNAKRIEAFGNLQKTLLDTTCLMPIVSKNSLRTYNTTKIKNVYFDENSAIYLNDAQ